MNDRIFWPFIFFMPALISGSALLLLLIIFSILFIHLNIFIMRKKISIKIEQVGLCPPPAPAAGGRRWRMRRLLLPWLLCALLPLSLGAQNLNVSGTVLDSQSEPVAGASVVVKGSTVGAITDANGGYSISVPADATLVFSFLGLATKEEAVNGRGRVDVTLNESDKALDEVVVVGYGVQKKANLTGSVSTISSDKLVNRPVQSLTTALAGLAPGVSATQTSGNPGSEEVTLRIRGTGSFNSSAPLILVDGVVADMIPVNADDVENITFLKDAASAAIYGSRAANGVILVTTKKGKKEKPKIVFSALAAQERAVTNVKFLSDMPTWMNTHNIAARNTAPETQALRYEQTTIDAWAAANANPNGTYTDEATGTAIPNWLAYPNTDWAQEIFQPTYFQKYNLSVTGGSDATTYFMSLGYQDNPGTLENTGMKRINTRINLETKVTDFLTFGTQTYATKEYKEPGDVAMTYLFQAFPSINPRHDGLYGYSEDPNMTPVNNILHTIASQGGMNEYTRVNTSWYANADIWKGISAEAKFNYNEYMREDEHYSQDIPLYRFREGTDKPVYGIGVLDQATTYRYAYHSRSYTADALLKYAGSFGKHSVSALLGYEQYWYQSSGFSATKKGLIDWSLTDITSAAEMDAISGSAKSDYAMLSYFGRVNYDYGGKYLFEANFRSDASSRFAPDYRWGTFPSFSVGWRPSEEAFFEPLKAAVSSLKLRASYGSLGNTVSGNYDWQALYKKVNNVFDESVANGVIQAQLPNYLLSWEKVTTFDLGFDALLLKNRLGVEFDWYRRNTEGILATSPLYLTMGNISAPMSNTADMQNTGVEITLSWNDKVGDVRYGASVNASYNINEVTKFKGALKYEQDPNTLDIWGNPTWRYTNLSDVSTGGDTRRVEGYAIDEYFLRRPYQGTGAYTNADGSVNPQGGPKDGMIRTKADLEWVKAMVAEGYTFNNNLTSVSENAGSLWYGEMIMADINGDGRYGNNDDREFIGKSATPKWIFGLNLYAEWKGIDVSMTWSGRLGSWSYINFRGVNASSVPNANDALPADAASLYYTYDAVKAHEGYDSYDPAADPTANVNGTYPRLLASASSAMVSNVFYLYNTSYFKLKALQIGYTLPQKWTTPAKISSLRIFLSGENLLTFASKDFPGVDPELGGSISVYPIARMISGGITIGF
jgi:TonB-linked SusC/RagA family outer membrane protein